MQAHTSGLTRLDNDQDSIYILNFHLHIYLLSVVFRSALTALGLITQMNFAPRPRVAFVVPVITLYRLCNLVPHSSFITVSYLEQLNFAIFTAKSVLVCIGNLHFHHIRRHIRQLRHWRPRLLGYPPIPCGPPIQMFVFPVSRVKITFICWRKFFDAT